MDSEKYIRRVTLLANIGVILGLVLVAIQINQNTEIMKAQIANDYYLADMSLELAIMGEDSAIALEKSIYAPDTLTRQDAIVLDRYFNYGLVQIHRLRAMDRLGLAHDDWEDRIGYLGWHLGNPVGIRWWATARNGVDEELQEDIDEVVGRHGGANQHLIDALLNSDVTELDDGE